MSHKQLATALEVGKNVYAELSQPRRKAQSALVPASKVTVTREIPNQSVHGVYSLHFVPDMDYVAVGRGNGSIGVSCFAVVCTPVCSPRCLCEGSVIRRIVRGIIRVICLSICTCELSIWH
jgi:hypothetical protein